LIVGVTGEIDAETGFVMDVKFLSEIIKEEVEDRFDHKNLNLDVLEFQELNPTAENIVVVIWNRIRKRIKPAFELEVVLYETPRNFVTYRGE
jgi:6-pyruvoyltetrahydropterin/6-carboxytetrahydropterin synthase